MRKLRHKRIMLFLPGHRILYAIMDLNTSNMALMTIPGQYTNLPIREYFQDGLNTHLEQA
jgi:hypothetical protein